MSAITKRTQLTQEPRNCPRCGLATISSITPEELARGAYEKCPDCGARHTSVPLIRCTTKPPCGFCHRGGYL